MPFFASRLPRWLPALTWMAFISYWSSQSDLPIDRPPIEHLLRGLQHPLAHAAAFAILALLIYHALLPGRYAAFWAVALVAAFGAADEGHQFFTPGRMVDPVDWLVDVSAALAAVTLVEVGRHRPAWTRSPLVTQLMRARTGLALAAMLMLMLSAVVIASPIDASSKAFAKESLRAAGRLVPDSVVPDSIATRVIRLADRALDAARAARVELRDQLLT